MLFHPDFNPSAFAEFTQGPAALDGFRSAVLTLNPDAFFRFSEPADSPTSSDLTNQQADATHHDGVITGAPSSLPLDPDRAVAFTGDGAYTRSPLVAPPADDFTINLRFKPGQQSTSPDRLFLQSSTPGQAILIQAEQYHTQTLGTSQASWTLINEGSNGSALQALPDIVTAFDTDYATQSPRLDYSINFKQSGLHYVWVYGRGTVSSTSQSDSVHTGLNQTPTPSGERIAQFQSTLGWSNTKTDSTRASLTIPQPGVHSLSVWMREDGFVFDRILLTTDPEYDPRIDALPADAIDRDSAIRPLLAGYASGRIDPEEPGLHLSLLNAADDLATLRYQLGQQNEHDVTASITTEQWHSLTLQRDGGMSKLFLNGQLIHTGTAGALSLSHPIDLGGSPRDDVAGFRFANTQLDELAYFSRSLSPSGILDLHRRASDALHP
ncbi:MAG: LamG-like jellyroll fold domain-containing protein [Planctomycetota bacterium]